MNESPSSLSIRLSNFKPIYNFEKSGMVPEFTFARDSFTWSEISNIWFPAAKYFTSPLNNLCSDVGVKQMV
jgi:hypothetical protein